MCIPTPNTGPLNPLFHTFAEFRLTSFPVSHKVGNVVNFVLGIEVKGIWSNSINLVLQLK